MYRESLCCIRCGACLNTCPVYRRSGGYSYHATIPGPIGSVLNAASDPKTFHSLPYACSLCGSCADVCPVKIPLDQQLLHLRGTIAAQGYLPLSKRLLMKMTSFVMQRTWLFSFGRPCGAVVGAQVAAIPDVQPTQCLGKTAGDSGVSAAEFPRALQEPTSVMNSKQRDSATLRRDQVPPVELPVPRRTVADVRPTARPVLPGPRGGWRTDADGAGSGEPGPGFGRTARRFAPPARLVAGPPVPSTGRDWYDREGSS